MEIMENQVKHKYLWVLGLIRVNTNEHVSGEKKGHLQSAGVAGMTLVMRCPSPPMSGSHILNRFPTTAKMKGDIYHLSCLLHSYIDVSNYTKKLHHFLVRQKEKKNNIKMP